VDDCNEYIDQQIASHILNLHINQSDYEYQDSIDQKKFLLYIRFAKLLKPKMTKEAAHLLREKYMELRQEDLGSYSMTQKTSYRITVRQLESLIRLSEAIARANLDYKIKPDYVKEAAKLLSKSIIPIQFNDVELVLHEVKKPISNLNSNANPVNDDNNEEKDSNVKGSSMEVEIDDANVEQVEGEDNNKTNLNKESNVEEIPKIKLTGEEYEDVKNIIIYYVREVESQGNII
jgi:DNA replication licensing factor MCM6